MDKEYRDLLNNKRRVYNGSRNVVGISIYDYVGEEVSKIVEYLLDKEYSIEAVYYLICTEVSDKLNRVLIGLDN